MGAMTFLIDNLLINYILQTKKQTLIYNKLIYIFIYVPYMTCRVHELRNELEEYSLEASKTVCSIKKKL